jgi:hypothetical protein
VGTQITSPAEAAARAESPEASLITVAVEQRVLSADIIARGAIDYTDPISLETSGSTSETEARAIVTGVAAVGDELLEGAVSLEVAGRPVILLQGDLPVFRDLKPGATGLDVLQLEQSLVRQGFLNKADETWDNRTGAAIQSLYAAVGYEAAAVSDAEREALKAARESVRFASEALADANRAIEDAGGATGSTLLEAEAAVASAQEALAIAKAARTAAIASANGEVTAAQGQVANAEAALDVAEARRDQAVIDGIHPDTGNPPTALETAELEAAVSAAELDVTVAENDLVSVQAQLSVVTTQENAAVTAAERQLGIAKSQLKEAKAPGDLTLLIRARDDARRALADANEEFVRIEGSVGTWLPSGEVIFVKNLPVQVTEVRVKRGDILGGAFMTVSGADIAMTIGMQENDARRVSVGDTVIIDEPDLLPEPVEATISEIPEASQSGRIQVRVDIPDLPPELLGANVRVIIPVESTSGEVLVVPAAALSAVANGDTRVEVEDPTTPGSTRFVTVITGLAADGVVEVEPVDGSLKAGDRVVVGQADIGSPDDGASAEPDDDSESAADG